jgi:hypothetical protein
MPDVQSGIEVEEQGVIDPNSDAGFAESLARATGNELPEGEAQRLSEGERSVEAGLEVEEPGGPARGPDGKFTSRTPAEEPVAEQTPPGEVEQTPEEAEAERLLAGKFKSSEELERGYKELESKLGQRDEATERRIAELEQATREREQRRELPPLPVASEETMAQLDSMVARNGGVETITWLAENRPDLLEAGYEAWKATDDPRAEQAEMIYRTALATQPWQQSAPQAAPQRDPILEELHMKRRLEGQLDVVKSTAPDWDQIKPHVYESFQELPQHLQAGLVAEDPEAIQTSMYALVQTARVKAREKLATFAAQSGEEGRQAQVAAKQATAIATGGLRSVAPAGAGEAPADETPQEKSERVRAALHAALLGTETADVREGLTYS